ncbi:small GTP-binding protein [Tritrichomonas foetus]|uniref:Small GTP-binding protein n=1 Tax=Tritrichomonas foetus TaxID=1144522 RepID=A0A1J4K7M7_9EUKA|nr:small GTP-binding protein [Tritrichomonas foetus]|eukprot:OHT07203.1 small GTP-binding protein [Tritrichomonas foetus]
MLGKKYDQSVKTVVVGDSGVGKTCILFRFVRDDFEEGTPATLGVEFMSRIIETKTRRIELQLWDTAGQELFRAVTRGYYRGSIGAFIVYDITKRDSFENISRWLNDVKSTARADVVCVLIGNKSDLSDNREVTKEEAQEFAEKNHMAFFETSAKTGENIEEAMRSCLISVEKMIDEGKYDGKIGIESVVNDDNQDAGSHSSCC